MRAWFFLLLRASACLCVSSALSVASAQALGELPEADQSEIARICLPIQYSEGATAYRQCVNEQVTARTNPSVNSGNALAGTSSVDLTFDERYAIQQTCRQAGNPGTAAYNNCETEQLQSLSTVPAPRLALLSDDENYALQQTCFDAQTSSGVLAYRRCLNESLAKLLSLPEPDLSSLPLLEKNAVQLRCSSLHDIAVDYRACLLDAVDGKTVSGPIDSGFVSAGSQPAVSDTTLLQEPTPAQADERTTNSLNDGNLATPSNNAPATIPDQTQIAASDQAAIDSDELPVPALQNLPADDANVLPDGQAIADDLSAQPDIPDDDSNTLTATINSEASESAVAETAIQSQSTNAQDTASQADTDLVAPDQSAGIQPGIQIAELGEPDAESEARSNTSSLTSTGSDNEDNIAAPTDAEPESIGTSVTGNVKNQAGQLWGQLQSSVDKLTGLNRIVVFGALALPLLLAGFWLMMRRREPESAYVPPPHPEPLTERIGPSQQRRARVNPDSLVNSSIESLDFEAQAEELFGSESEPSELPRVANARTAVTRRVDDDERNTLAAATNEQSASTQSADFANPDAQQRRQGETPATKRLDFLNWLGTHAEDAQPGLVIEFMIYWTAYADERYEPSVKARVFSLKELDDHDLIKRWVLMQDVQAFTQSVQWLQDNASMQQRVQLLNLLMALLVNENALTPVQNTLLRFLGDVFGLGFDALNENFSQAFGQPMPPLPRVDKPNWWKRQSRESLSRWDARWVSKQEAQLQHRLKLGLPLKGPLSEQLIHEHFDRAFWRCQPERFGALSEREQKLAHSQIAKFEMARNGLLEVLA